MSGLPAAPKAPSGAWLVAASPSHPELGKALFARDNKWGRWARNGFLAPFAVGLIVPMAAMASGSAGAVLKVLVGLTMAASGFAQFASVFFLVRWLIDGDSFVAYTGGLANSTKSLAFDEVEGLTVMWAGSQDAVAIRTTVRGPGVTFEVSGTNDENQAIARWLDQVVTPRLAARGVEQLAAGQPMICGVHRAELAGAYLWGMKPSPSLVPWEDLDAPRVEGSELILVGRDEEGDRVEVRLARSLQNADAFRAVCEAMRDAARSS